MAEHIPVMADEIVAGFKEQSLPLRHLFEGTFGRGGHTRLLFSTFPELKVTSFDRDQDAIEHGRKTFKEELKSERLQLIQDDFKSFKEYKLAPLDGVLVDLGVSSPQLDDESRGFSFSKDGPLDMRMNRYQKLTAALIVNEWDDRDLVDLFKSYGEIFKPHRIVNCIVRDRKEAPFETTRQLASLIERVEGYRPYKHQKHPATQYFQALRIAVNRELDGLYEFVHEVCEDVQAGGRIIIISFHSLEDRIIKTAFRNLDKKQGRIITKKVMIPTEEEIARNPRARSSKLRIFERG